MKHIKIKLVNGKTVYKYRDSLYNNNKENNIGKVVLSCGCFDPVENSFVYF